MRLTYEPPEIALLGSVRELTQAELLSPGADGSSFLGISLGGEKDPVFS